jgi:hypothetical protein
MRILLRIAAVVAVVLVVALIALALLLPNVLASDAVRGQIQAAADGVLGREVRYAALDFGLFPPSLQAVDVAIAGASAESPPLIEAERVALRVALLPLLTRTVVLDSLVVHGAAAHLVRTEDGIQLPRPPPAQSPPAARAEPSAAAAAEGAFAVDLAPAGFELRDATVVLEDRSVTPPVIWEARNVALHARGAALDGPVDFDLSLDLASGGRIAAAGSATLAGEIDVQVELDAVGVAPVRPYLDPGSELAGTASGTVVVRGPAADLASVRVDIALEDGHVQLEDVTLRGHVEIEADVQGALAAPRGTFDIDATAAEIRYGEMFKKPPGDAATVKGNIVTESDGTPGVDDVHLKIRNFKASARVSTGRRIRVVATAPPFDLDGWEVLILALAGYQLTGLVRIDELEVMTSPLEVRGSLHLDGVTAVIPDRGPVRIDGALVGAGDVIDTVGLAIGAADEVIAVDGSIRELDREVRYRVHVGAAAADTNRLVSTFTSKRDFVYGLLTLEGDVHGTVAGERPPLEALAGSVRIDIGKGRLRGVSMLQLAFDRLRVLGSVAQVATRLFTGSDLERFYGDDFREIRGTFDFQGGVARTDDFRIVYRDYTVDLRGTIRLRDLGIDMTGRITIGESIGAALGRRDRAGPLDTIQLARVTGTLDEPRLELDHAAAILFVTRYGVGSGVEKLIGREAEKGVEILKDIGILGGSRRRQ